MATPADQRLLELLEKWLTSLELHAKYASLDDDSYSKVQPWPEHQRPSRWIIDLARQKAITLRNSLEERIKMGDAKFSDSLELMTFLANLVGSEHIERFIPVADPATERTVGHDTQNAPTVEAPGPAASGTREMPKFIAGTPREPPASGTAQVARTERKAKAPPVKPAPAAPAPPSSSESASAGQEGPSQDVREQVIADAVRLVQWGRKWYELAEVIAKMADRPHLTDVRRILKDNKAVIDKRAGRG
ncbi:MAG TPA: hypothetical protein VN325_08825 [Steroidobacteraceae bacterium]|nr:hypothetical protein [Steroidobacteraceae bacterium]